MEPYQYDLERTKTLLQAIWSVGYHRLDIDARQPYIFASPSHAYWPKRSHRLYCEIGRRTLCPNGPPLFRVFTELGFTFDQGFLMHSERGDHLRITCAEPRILQPGIYSRTRRPWFWFEEKKEKFFEQRMLVEMHNKMTRSHVLMPDGISCPHGDQSGSCKKHCWYRFDMLR